MLREEIVIAEVVPCESTTVWRGGICWRVVPNTSKIGFSGITPTRETAPVAISTDCSVPASGSEHRIAS